MHLGLHCSRQSFTATITNKDTSERLFQKTLLFDEDLAHRNTTGGFIQDPDTHQCYIDPQMLVEALEMLFFNIHYENPSLITQIRTISGSSAAGLIFLNHPISEIKFNPNIPLTDLLRPYYTNRYSSILRDQSAKNAVKIITREFNPSTPIRNITGAVITSHTGAAQIKKIATEQPDVWLKTSNIHTAGSFLCSLLIGGNASLDITDSSQLGLVDIRLKKWHHDIIECVAPNLLRKLPKLVETPYNSGNISDYFQLKYGFSSSAQCLAWISEEASYCLGIGSLSPGKATLTLNDSYTLNVSMKTIPTDIPNATTKVTVHPLNGFNAHVRLSNGLVSLLHVAEKLSIKHETINSQLKTIDSVIDELHLPFLHRDPILKIPSVNFDYTNILSITNGQLLHLKLFSQWIEQKMNSIIITGEGAKLSAMRQLCADIFQCSCYSIQSTNIHTIGIIVLAEIHLELPYKKIKNKYHCEKFTEYKTPDSYMADIYNSAMNKYHQLLSKHLSK